MVSSPNFLKKKEEEVPAFACTPNRFKVRACLDQLTSRKFSEVGELIPDLYQKSRTVIRLSATVDHCIGPPPFVSLLN